MKNIWNAILVIVAIIGLYRSIQYFSDKDYEKKFDEKIESIYESQTDTYKTIFKYSIFTLLVFAGTFVIIAVTFTRWRKIRVFLSYNIENEEIAQKIKKAINNYPIEAYYLPYSNLNHNEIIQKVTQMIKKSHAVIAIPGNRTESNFTDAEIMTASTLKKPIIMLVLNEEQKLPNTAYTGYPHFRYSYNNVSLRDPISYFLMNTFRHFNILGSIINRGLIFLRDFSWIILGIAIILAYCIEILGVFGTFISLKLFPYYLGIMVVIIFIGLFSYLIFMILQQYRLARIANQSQQTGDLTYDELYSIFKYDKSRGNDVLNSLVKESLKKRH